MNTTICILTLLSFSAGDNFQVLEGDPKLYEMLRAAQKTSMARLAKGRLKAKVSLDGGSKFRQNGEVVHIWSGEKAYAEYTLTTDALAHPSMTMMHSRLAHRLIEEPDLLHLYAPRSDILHTSHSGARSYPKVLKIRPDQLWFAYDGIQTRRWIDFLRPETFSAEIIRRVLKRENENRIVLVQTHRSSGQSARIVFSLAHGGNVISYKAVPGDGKKGNFRPESYKYEWVKHPKGVWYLHKYSYQTKSPDEDPERTANFSMEVTEFDPDPKISRGQFSLSALRVPSGAKVQETGPEGMRKKYYFGKKPRKDKDIVLLLNRLAQKLRSKGFARKNRK